MLNFCVVSASPKKVESWYVMLALDLDLELGTAAFDPGCVKRAIDLFSGSLYHS